MLAPSNLSANELLKKTVLENMGCWQKESESEKSRLLQSTTRLIRVNMLRLQLEGSFFFCLFLKFESKFDHEYVLSFQVNFGSYRF